MAFCSPHHGSALTYLPAKTVIRTRQQRDSKSCAPDKDPGHDPINISFHTTAPQHTQATTIASQHHITNHSARDARRQTTMPTTMHTSHTDRAATRLLPKTVGRVRRQNHRAALASTSWISTTRASSPAHRAACFGAGRDLRGVMRRWVGGLGWRDWEARIGEWSLMCGGC